MTNYSHGQKAENAAAEYLRKHKFEILSQNWRTRYCEIDIVAKKRKVIYFAEVKYRKTTSQGSGLEYITEKKLQQMKLAAEFWVSDNSWGGDYRLAAVEVSGNQFEVSNFIESLDL